MTTLKQIRRENCAIYHLTISGVTTSGTAEEAEEAIQEETEISLEEEESVQE